MQPRPGTERRERGRVPGRDRPAPVRADVQQQVAALGHGVHEHAHQQVRVLEPGVVPVVAPAAVQRLAGLPGDGCPVVGAHGLVRLVLLRGDQVARDAEAVVDHGLRLQLADQGEQPLRVPVLGVLAAPPVPVVGVGVVEEHVVDGAVPGEQLAHLRVQVGAVPRHVAPLVQGVGVRVVPARVHEVHGEVRVVPVDQRVVQPQAQPLGAHGLGQLRDQVAPARARDGVVADGGVPQGEAVVVLRGQHHVPHPRLLGRARDRPGVEQVGVEHLGVPLVLLDGLALVAHHPLVPGRGGVEPEVHEQAEPGLGEPGPVRVGQRGGIGRLGHVRITPRRADGPGAGRGMTYCSEWVEPSGSRT